MRRTRSPYEENRSGESIALADGDAGRLRIRRAEPVRRSLERLPAEILYRIEGRREDRAQP
jgi:hypothetical protein